MKRMEYSYFGCVHETNKPELATMRPVCVSACIDHVKYMDKQTVKKTDVRQE